MDPDQQPCLKHGSIENEMNSTDRRERNMFSDITFFSQLTQLHATLENDNYRNIYTYCVPRSYRKSVL